MSIEEALAKNTEAVNRNSALLEKMMAGAGKAGTTTTAAASTKPAGTKPAAGSKKALTEEDLRNTFGGYMSTGKFPTEKPERKAMVAAIIAHFGVEKVTDIPEENRAEAIGYVKTLESGEKPNFMSEEGGDDDDGGESML